MATVIKTIWYWFLTKASEALNWERKVFLTNSTGTDDLDGNKNEPRLIHYIPYKIDLKGIID